MEEKKNTFNYHLDKSVLIFFAVTILCFSSLFAYKFYSTEDCPLVQFKTEAKNFRAGTLIRFTDYTEGANSWEWQFDDSTNVRKERNPYHTFVKPGKYDVRLLVNKSCELIKTIVIEEKIFVLDSTKLPKFIAPKEVFVGDKIWVEDKTEGATSWEWRFGETAKVNAYDQKSHYTYEEPGLKTISLVVNGDLKYIAKKKIKVLPKPKETDDMLDEIIPTAPSGVNINVKPDIGLKEEKPKKEKAPDISKKDFAQIFVDISEEKLTPEAFKPYVCGNLNIPVIVNKKEEKLLVLCQRITGKNIKVKDLQIIRDKESNCITDVLIDINIGWF
ncbi:PKD domain-containing protein [Mesonia phycicola]|uniref:PKD domain-containing protein n=1 Tax=Mesonia phycicola TaxID=579105 RepID=A0A1M6FZS1_9FLAO|nr:PKD domain-containing protein [Mesonia phycicola]SHJ03144.1 PKD domain-containing protein [Mesonia phycicola]